MKPTEFIFRTAPSRRWIALCFVALTASALAHGPFPTVHVKELPDALRANSYIRKEWLEV